MPADCPDSILEAVNRWVRPRFPRYMSHAASRLHCTAWQATFRLLPAWECAIISAREMLPVVLARTGLVEGHGSVRCD
jgi:hypothetical protein